MRWLTGLFAVLTAATTGVDPACVSNASPAGGQCNFVLGPLQVVEVSGSHFVRATMTPGPCTIAGSGNFSEVCLTISGDDSAGQCASEVGSGPAILDYTYRPGATYVVTGKGCASMIRPPYSLCQSFGPSRAAL
jgi:hypothetical protein